MKFILKPIQILSIMTGIFFLSGCGNDDGNVPTPMDPDMMDPDMEEPVTETASKTFVLGAVDNPDISGTAKFITFSNDSTVVELKLENTTDGSMHPAHIHFNTAAEGGDIALTLATVDGSTGESTTHVTVLEDGSAINYTQLLDYDGYINVHLSAEDPGTLVAQGDIGQNELTDDSKTYTLGSVAVVDISGTATFTKRVNGEALAVIALENTPEGVMHPGHIHFNTAVEGGDIAFTFNPVNGDTGMSITNVAALNDETAFGYDALLEFDGYINIHMSMDDLGTLIAQGDIGQNELTGESKEYVLGSKDVVTIDGTATFFERINGEALAVIELDGTVDGGMHPGHIHANTAAEGGDILFTFNPVVGATGMSKTNLAALNDDTAFGYSDVLAVDGYINIHLSVDELGTLIAQGDIGQNELTGTSKEYVLGSKDVVTIDGTATFFERINGEALAVIMLNGTSDGGIHPGHIHANSAAVGGDILFTFNPVVGATGISETNLAALNDNTAFGYSDVLTVDGYINIHLSMADLGTLIAQGNIGSNEGDDGAEESKDFVVTNSGAMSYIFNSDDVTNAENPDLTLKRGETYTFAVNASGHPFFIKSVQGNTNANAYNDGVTNNGTQDGTITFVVPMNAPDTLFYNCQFHSMMTGTLNIID